MHAPGGRKAPDHCHRGTAEILRGRSSGSDWQGSRGRSVRRIAQATSRSQFPFRRSGWPNRLKGNGKFQPDRNGGDARSSIGKPAWQILRTSLANRRCSEWRAAVGQTKAAPKHRWKALLRQCGTEVRGRTVSGLKSRKGRKFGHEEPRNGFGTARREERFPRNQSDRLTGPDAGAISPGEVCRLR
jgi:hypothetical protein